MYEVLNLPIPETESLKGNQGKYPWHKMEVGQSFIVPASDVSFRNIRNACFAASRANQREYRAARLPNGSYQVVRIS